MRVAAVWFPDWPIQAAGGQGPYGYCAQSRGGGVR